MKEKTLAEAQKYEKQKKEVVRKKEKKRKNESFFKKMKKICEVFFISNLVRIV